MRLIDAAPMLEKLDLEHYDKDWYVSQYNADWISSWLESQPVIEAEPVKHGRWICTNMALGKYACSACGGVDITCGDYYSTHYAPDQDYCPNCGAKMDLEDTKNESL